MEKEKKTQKLRRIYYLNQSNTNELTTQFGFEKILLHTFFYQFYLLSVDFIIFWKKFYIYIMLWLKNNLKTKKDLKNVHLRFTVRLI